MLMLHGAVTVYNRYEDAEDVTNDPSGTSKKAKPTLIKVGPAQEIYYYAGRGLDGRGWYIREYHSPSAMKMFKARKMGRETYDDIGPSATKEEAVQHAARRAAGLVNPARRKAR